MKTRLFLFAITLSMLAFTACDDSDDNTTDTTSDSTDLASSCCPNAPEGAIHISANGQVINLATQQGAQVDLTPIEPQAALAPGDPTHLGDTSTDAQGAFNIDCLDVTNIALGLVVLTDDPGFDGGQGDFFPTGTGIKAWKTNEEKTCVEGAMAIALPNTMVAALDQLPNIDSINEGFVMGMVVDDAQAPVEGATITAGDGSDLSAGAYYPNADFSDLTSGTATSPNGLFLLPAANFPQGVASITANKEGHTFEIAQAAAKPEFCYFSVIQPL